MLVSDYSQINDDGEREEYIPVAQIMGVQFKNCGQRGYRDYYDPRYALALQNTQPGESSYVKSCSVDVSHNHAIGQSHVFFYFDARFISLLYNFRV